MIIRIQYHEIVTETAGILRLPRMGTLEPRVPRNERLVVKALMIIDWRLR